MKTRAMVQLNHRRRIQQDKNLQQVAHRVTDVVFHAPEYAMECAKLSAEEIAWDVVMHIALVHVEDVILHVPQLIVEDIVRIVVTITVANKLAQRQNLHATVVKHLVRAQALPNVVIVVIMVLKEKLIWLINILYQKHQITQI